MRTLKLMLAFLPLACHAQQFSFSARGHTYDVTVSTPSPISGLGNAGRGIYEGSLILPNSHMSSNYALLFTGNNTTYNFNSGESIFMQTSSDGTDWGSASAIIGLAPNLCDMADARPIWDDTAGFWRVFIQALAYDGESCGTDNEIYEATGSSLTSLSWYGSGGNATSLGSDAGSPGIGEQMQWFNTTNYDGPSSYPIMYFYNDWNFSDPDYTYCPTCTGNGTDMFAYVTPDAESAFYFWYYTSAASALANNTGCGGTGDACYMLFYPDVMLGGTEDQSTLGPPAFAFYSDCASNSQYGRGVGFFPTPVPNNDSSPSLPGQFVDGTFSSSVSGLIVSVRIGRNEYGFLDKTSSSPNTWQTLIVYNASDEVSGTSCPIPSIGTSDHNTGGSGSSSPSAAWSVSTVTITEQ